MLAAEAPVAAAALPSPDEVLEALLPHVAFDGWGETALRQAAADLGVDLALAQDALPGGALGQVLAFSGWADRGMQQALIDYDQPVPKLRNRIDLAVRLRLELLAPHRDAVRRGLGILALPGNAAAGLQALHRTADLIWNAAGDSATDYNWYSKRLLLAGVVSATTLYWLEDKSEDNAATWNFLSRQLSTVIKVGGKLGKAMTRLLNAPDRALQRLSGARRRYR